MAIEALLGGALGGIARLAPEVLKFFDRKNERKHELALGIQQHDLIKLQGDTKLRVDQLTADSAQMTAGIAALAKAYETQKSGLPWADGLTATVRPVLTYLFAGSYVALKVANYAQTGQIWSPVDEGFLAAILNFWFMGRVFEKK